MTEKINVTNQDFLPPPTNHLHLIWILIGGVIISLLSGSIGYYLGTQSFFNQQLDSQSPEINQVESSQVAGPITENHQDQVFPTPIISSQPTIVPTLTQENLYSCQSDDLDLSVTLPKSWTCQLHQLEPGSGSMVIEGGIFQIEIDNMGHGFGCNLEPNCKTANFYSSDLIDLQLLTKDNQDKYIFGVFKDNSNQKSYGGMMITYQEMSNRKLTVEEQTQLENVLNSFKRTN